MLKSNKNGLKKIWKRSTKNFKRRKNLKKLNPRNCLKRAKRSSSKKKKSLKRTRIMKNSGKKLRRRWFGKQKLKLKLRRKNKKKLNKLKFKLTPILESTRSVNFIFMSLMSSVRNQQSLLRKKKMIASLQRRCLRLSMVIFQCLNVNKL